MITFIRKLFIKDYDNVSDQTVRKKHGVLASVGGIIVNLLLFAFKLIIGLVTFSMSIITDAINNLSDLFSCFVNLIGFKVAGRPADKGHPYGHERVEYIAGMIISFVIICVAVVLGYSAVSKLISGESDTVYNTWAFGILGAAIVVKLLLGYFYYAIGKAINSVALKASRQDSISDAISTSAVLIAAIVQYFANGLWWLDGAMSLVVACFILYTGIKTVIETASPLLGVPADRGFVKSITDDIMSYQGVFGVHDVVCHAYGPTKMFVTAHIEVDGCADTFVTHEIIDSIEKELGVKYGLLLTVHMDPIDTRSEELADLKAKMSTILSDINANLSFHDLRMVAHNEHIDVIFDILVPSDCALACDDLPKLINEKLQSIDARYRAVITFDHDYM